MFHLKNSDFWTIFKCELQPRLNNNHVLVGMDTVIRELLPQQQPRTIERRDLQYITISKEELTSSDSLSPDPWKRDAREKAEKQQQLHIVDLLDKEIQELQVGRTQTHKLHK